MALKNKFNFFENKIKAQAKFKFIFTKYKGLFIGLFSTLSVGAGVLGIGTGAVTENVKVENFNYGENLVIENEVKLFMGEFLYYEYAENNSDVWSKNKPSKAGEYKVRAVTKGLFGGERRGEYTSFSISPIQSTISLSIPNKQIIYGDKPTAYSASLNSGDYIREIDYNFYSLNDKDYCCVDLDKVKVYSSTGDDVTSSYLFNTEAVEINYINRNIDIKFDDISFCYNGQSNDIKLSYTANLINNDKVDAITYKIYDDELNEVELDNIIDVGTYTVKIDNVSVSSGHYNINKLDSYIYVTKKDVSITTPTHTFTYDGEYHSYIEGCSAIGLNDGDKLEVINSSINFIKDVGEINNSLLFKILDKDNNDVTDNYSLSSFNYGKIIVEPKEISVTATLSNKIYDGKIANFENIEISGLVNGDNLDSYIHSKFSLDNTFTSLISPKNANTYYGTLYLDSSIKNYSLSFDPVQLVISKKTLTIVPDDITITYLDVINYNNLTYSIDGFIDGESYSTVSKSGSLVFSSNYQKGDSIGSYELSCSSLSFTNYNPDYSTKGSITVNPREVTIYWIGSSTQQYQISGVLETPKAYYLLPNSLDKHYLKVTADFDEVKPSTATYSYTADTSDTNFTFTNSLSNSNYKFIVDLTKHYVEYPTLNISSVTYTGETFNVTYPTSSYYSLDTSKSSSLSIKDAGTYTYYFNVNSETSRWINGGSEEYSLEVTINKASVDVIWDNLIHTYNNLEKEKPTAKFAILNGYQTISADYIICDDTSKNVGSYTYYINGYVNENFDLNYSSTITNNYKIVAKEINVTVKDKSVEYGQVFGLVPTTSDFIIDTNNLASGDNISDLYSSLSYSTNYNQNDKNKDGGYTLSITGFNNSNYSYNFINGKLTVTKKDLDITWDYNDSYTYNFTSQLSTVRAYISSIDNVDLTAYIKFNTGSKDNTFTAAGDYSFSVDFDAINDNDILNILDNYNLSSNLLELSISKLSISKPTIFDSYEYMGTNISPVYSSTSSYFAANQSVSSTSIYTVTGDLSKKDVSDNYHVTFTLTDPSLLWSGEENNYISLDYKITAASLKVNLDNISVIYGDDISTTLTLNNGYTLSNFKGSDNASNITLTGYIKINSSKDSSTSVGTYNNVISIDPSLSTLSVKNYILDLTDTADLTITAKSIDVVFEGIKDYVYGESSAVAAYYLDNNSNKVYLSTPSIYSGNDTFKNVGSYVFKVNETTSSDNNYIFNETSRYSNIVKIVKKAITLNVKDQEVTYGNELDIDIDNNFISNTPAFEYGETLLSLSPSLSISTDYIPYTSTTSSSCYITLSGDLDNYDLTIIKGNITVNKLSVDLSWTYNDSYTYTSSKNLLDNIKCSYTVNGIKYDVNEFEVTSGQGKFENVGSYTIKAKISDDNLSFTNLTINTSIIKMNIDIPTLSTSFDYDAKEHSITLPSEYTSLCELSGDFKGINAGTYNYTVSVKDSTNMCFSDSTTSKNKSFTINKITATVTLRDINVTYGDSLVNNYLTYSSTNTNYSFDVSGLLESNVTAGLTSISFTTSYNAGDDAGEYTATPVTPTLTNYNVTFSNTFTVVVGKKNVNVSYNYTKTNFTYGENNIPTSIITTYTNISNTTSYVEYTPESNVTFKDVGEYCYIFKENKNYNYNVNSTDTLTIAPATLTITIQDEEICFGDDIPYNITATGFKYGEDISVGKNNTATITSVTSIGTYQQSTNISFDNYIYEEVTATLKVNPKQLTVTWNAPDNPTYDGEEHTFTPTVDVPNSITFTGLKYKNAGEYKYTISSNNPNYTLDKTELTLNVLKKSILIDINNLEINYGDDIIYTYVISGICSGDNITNDLRSYTINTSPKDIPDVGTYEIKFDNLVLTNYWLVNSANATLTVNQVAASINFEVENSYTYGSSPATVKAYYMIGDSKKYVSVSEDNGKTFKDVGTYLFVTDINNEGNYYFENMSKEVTITKATLHATTYSDPSSITYGDSYLLKVKYTAADFKYDENSDTAEHNTETLSLNIDNDEGYIAKTYLINLDVTFKNYNLVISKGSLVVNKKEVALTWTLNNSANENNLVYTGNPYTVTITYTVGGQLKTLENDFSFTNAGTYNFNAPTHNCYSYTTLTASKSYTVKPAELTIKVDDINIDYGEDLPEFTYGSLDETFVESLRDYTYVDTTDTVYSASKTYTIKIDYQNCSLGNYCVPSTYTPGTLTVNKVLVTIPTYQTQFTYNGSPQGPSFTDNRFKSMDYSNNIAVNTYTPTLSLTDEAYLNYYLEGNVQATTITYTIAAKPLTVSYSSQTVTYDGKEHTPTNNPIGVTSFITTGTKNNLPKASLSIQVDESALDYDIYHVKYGTGNKIESYTVSIPAAAVHIYEGLVDVTSNFIITSNSLKYKVTQKAATYTSSSKSWVFDNTSHSFNEWSLDGVYEDSAQIESTSTSIINVGSADNVITFIDNTDLEFYTGDYSITGTYGTLTITPRDITVSYNGPVSFEYDKLIKTPVNIYNFTLDGNGKTLAELGFDTSYLSIKYYQDNAIVSGLNSLGDYIVNLVYTKTSNKDNFNLVNNSVAITCTTREVALPIYHEDVNYDGYSHKLIELSDTTYSSFNDISASPTQISVGTYTYVIDLADNCVWEGTTSSASITKDIKLLPTSVIASLSSFSVNPNDYFTIPTPTYKHGDTSIVTSFTLTYTITDEDNNTFDYTNSLMLEPGTYTYNVKNIGVVNDNYQLTHSTTGTITVLDAGIYDLVWDCDDTMTYNPNFVLKPYIIYQGTYHYFEYEVVSSLKNYTEFDKPDTYVVRALVTEFETNNSVSINNITESKTITVNPIIINISFDSKIYWYGSNYSDEDIIKDSIHLTIVSEDDYKTDANISALSLSLSTEYNSKSDVGNYDATISNASSVDGTMKNDYYKYNFVNDAFNIKVIPLNIDVNTDNKTKYFNFNKQTLEADDIIDASKLPSGQVVRLYTDNKYVGINTDNTEIEIIKNTTVTINKIEIYDTTTSTIISTFDWVNNFSTGNNYQLNISTRQVGLTLKKGGYIVASDSASAVLNEPGELSLNTFTFITPTSSEIGVALSVYGMTAIDQIPNIDDQFTYTCKSTTAKLTQDDIDNYEGPIVVTNRINSVKFYYNGKTSKELEQMYQILCLRNGTLTIIYEPVD